ncbi:MAG TPA: helicase-related protein, partial [Mariniflexile sp.]|nr:helicase-related protein [Mariniflexile sp.]
IPLLPHVINFELPNIPEDYVHRIGRTGRAGASGEAISLVSADETTFLRDIEKLVGIKIPTEILEGFEPDPNASTEPEKRQQRGGTRDRSRNNEQQAHARTQKNDSNRRPKSSNNRRRTDRHH